MSSSSLKKVANYLIDWPFRIMLKKSMMSVEFIGVPGAPDGCAIAFKVMKLYDLYLMSKYESS